MFNNKKIFITGSEGFIGSNLVERLANENCMINCLVYYNSFNSWGWLDKLDFKKKKNINIVLGDVRDGELMRKLTKNVDIVFHLAALIGIPYSYVAARSYVETNVLGTLNILEACKYNSCKKLIITSTSEVYGSAIYTPIDEKHPLNAQSPYSASKIAADKISESYFNSFELPVTIVRPFNTYGPRQSSRAIIPSVINQVLNGNKIIKVGNIYPKRDLTYVEDTVEGFLKIANSKKTNGKLINICSNEEISIYNLVRLIMKKMNFKGKLEISKNRKRKELSEVDRLLGSNKLLEKIVNWKPKTLLDVGLDKTIEWFKSNHKKDFKHNNYTI